MQRILVAEDSFALANLLDFVLKSAGYDVTIKRTGAAAQQAGHNSEFDVILLDQQMPMMTGVQVTESLRAEGPNQHTAIFLCTAKTHELDLDYIKNTLHVQDVFHKPFSPRDLIQDLKSAHQIDVVQSN